MKRRRAALREGMMSEPSSSTQPNAVEALRRPVPAILLRVGLVTGALLIGGAFAFGTPVGVVRDDIVAGILLAVISSYLLTRTGRGEGVSPALTAGGILVSLWLVVFTGQAGFGSALGRISLVLGIFSTCSFGFLHRVNARAHRRK